jgi:hypothetical protein
VFVHQIDLLFIPFTSANLACLFSSLTINVMLDLSTVRFPDARS